MTFIPLTETHFVSPQISLDDVRRAAEQGVGMIIDNRPDGEDPTQPQAAEIAAAARENRLAFAYIPVTGRPGPDAVEAMIAALSSRHGAVLAYCRSGTRSTITWALAETAVGNLTPAEAVAIGRAAGYDLSALF